jgi:tellurite resistance protein TerC
LLDKLTFWIIFWITVSILFFIDLYVTGHRKGKITIRASLLWSVIWICTALLFNIFLYYYLEDGREKALQFLTGYLIEKSLSVDNLFVFLLIFKEMNVHPIEQPQVLKWGIIGAVVFRIIFIIVGLELIEFLHQIIYVFAFILLYAAYKMAFGGEYKVTVDKNPLVRFFRRFFNVLPGYCGKHFFVKKEGKTYATALFIPLLLIESVDIVFALDSIPAIMAITTDKLIIITSNVFAILGLRALYFALEGIVGLFKYLKYGVAIVLFYVGIKMMLTDFYKISTIMSLGVIVICLSGAVIFSLIYRKKDTSLSSKTD